MSEIKAGDLWIYDPGRDRVLYRTVKWDKDMWLLEWVEDPSRNLFICDAELNQSRMWEKLVVKVGDTWRFTPAIDKSRTECYKVVSEAQEDRFGMPSWGMVSEYDGTRACMELRYIRVKLWEKVRGVEEGEPKSRYERAPIV